MGRRPVLPAVPQPRAAEALRVGGVRHGVEATLEALDDLGRLELVDAGLVALARTLADCIDDEVCELEPQRHRVATLAGRLEPLLLALRGQPTEPVDAIDVLLEEMRVEVDP